MDNEKPFEDHQLLLTQWLACRPQRSMGSTWTYQKSKTCTPEQLRELWFKLVIEFLNAKLH